MFNDILGLSTFSTVISSYTLESLRETEYAHCELEGF